jgi:hypothetical protein
VTRWQRYWFDDGGRHALAIVRICVALAVLASLARLAASVPLVRDLYRPVGIWMLVGDTPPSPLAVSALFVIAWLATFAMLLGLVTRTATAISCVTSIALASLSTSHQAHWSHVFNIVFLAQLALLGARAGDVLSLDALLHGPRDVPRGYQWSLRLVRFAVALVFVGAAFHKLAHGGFTLRWALSDNLRHHLLVRYDLANLPHPALVDWLLADVWRYRTAALLNLVTQLAPLLVVLFPRRARLRAVAGCAFVIEILAIGLVFDYWNLHWIPLAAVFFVDGTASPRPAVIPRARFIAPFVTLVVLTGFIPTLDRRLNAYPFTAFPMFASIRARAPYDQHLPYSVTGDVFDAGPLSAATQTFLDHHYRGTHLITDPMKLCAQLAHIRHEMNTRYFPRQHITRLAHYRVVFEAPAYPAPARFERRSIALTATLDACRPAAALPR